MPVSTSLWDTEFGIMLLREPQLPKNNRTVSPHAQVKEIFFRKTSDCYIHESNDGGAYKDEHSPEACAQLCLNDKSCVSFDAGAVVAGTNGQRWQPAIDDCFLSYKNRSAVDSADFVCNSDAGIRVTWAFDLGHFPRAFLNAT